MRNQSRQAVIRILGIAAAAFVTTAVLPSSASAQVAVPEIDPGTASGVVSLVLGGVAILVDRIRR